MVARYTGVDNPYEMTEWDHGEFVKYDDYAALQAENERLREVLGRILENEAPDWKFREEFGGYVLDDDLREEARAALRRGIGND